MSVFRTRSVRQGFLASVLLAVCAVPVQAQASGDWEYDLTPLYLWGVSLSGDMTIKKPPFSPTIPLDVDFDDAISDLSGIFTVHFEARKERWGYYGDFSYLRLTPETKLPTGQKVKTDFRNPLFEAAGLYRLGAASDSPWWLVAGLRYMKMDVEVKGLPAPLPIDKVDVSKDLTDVFGGIRYRRDFGNHWTVLAQGDVGAGSSDLTWAATLFADYRFSDRTSVMAGWRWLDYDYSDRSVEMDMLMNGPLIAVSFHW